MYKLGIDLAKNATGWAILDEDTIVYSNYQQPFGIAYLWDDNIIKMIAKCYCFANNINNKVFSHEINVFIELGNYGNAKMTCDFALLCGILSTALEKVCNVVELKIFNANEWYKRVPNAKIGDCRELRKQTSFEHATSIDWKNSDTEDCDVGYEDYVNENDEIDDNIADAINIALFGPQCESFTSQRVFTMEKKKIAKNTLKMKNRALRKIITLQNKLNQAKTQKTKDKINNMIMELKNENK